MRPCPNLYLSPIRFIIGEMCQHLPHIDLHSPFISPKLRHNSTHNPLPLPPLTQAPGAPPFLVAEIKRLNQSNIDEKAFILMMVQGSSPLGGEFVATGDVVSLVRKQR